MRILLVLLLAGCTAIGERKVENWPELMRVERRVGLLEINQHCGTFVPWWQLPLGCAIFDLNERTCTIYYTWDWVLKHERMHCAGYEHEGETEMTKFYNRYRGAQL